MYKITVRLYWDECPGLGTVESHKDLVLRVASIEMAEDRAEELTEKYSAVSYKIVGDGVLA
jgi:hypothetical protein